MKVEGPRALRERRNSQLLQQCVLTEKTYETISTDAVNEAKWLLMLYYFLTMEGVFKQRRMQKLRFRGGLEKDHFIQQISKI